MTKDLDTVRPEKMRDMGSMESLVSSGEKSIARSQLAWLLLLADNAVDRLKVPTITSPAADKRAGPTKARG